jgi:hypothetical protein
MKIACLLVAVAVLPLLAGCENNPLENWAYQRVSAASAAQDNPPPRPAPPASRGVNTAPLRTLPPQ